MERFVSHTVTHITMSPKVKKSKAAFCTQTYLSPGSEIKLVKFVLSVVQPRWKTTKQSPLLYILICVSGLPTHFICHHLSLLGLIVFSATKLSNSIPDQCCIRMLQPAEFAWWTLSFQRAKCMMQDALAVASSGMFCVCN